MAGREGRLRVKRRLQGIAFLAVIALLLGLTIVIYQKKLPWQGSLHVTLDAHRIGNQLIIPADVKYDGVLVGRVSHVRSNGDEAFLNLQLSKSLAKRIPENVVARILPKTLFGEKYVDLVNPSSAADTAPAITNLKPAVIHEDDSQVAVELQTVFSQLVPILKAADPTDLSIALSNTAQALQGRGNELGHSLSLINSYFSQLNQDLPNIEHDISGLADLASNYADASPDLLNILHNFSITAKTFTVKQDPFAQFLAGTAGFANEGTKFLNTNGAGLIKLAKSSVAPLNLLSNYSIVLECLPKGLSIFDRTRLEKAFKGGELHIDLIPVNDRGAYTSKDKPTLKEFTNATLPANCYGLPYGSHALHPENSKYPFAPGGNYSKGGFLGASTSTASTSLLKPAVDGSTDGVGSQAEQDEINTLLAEIDGKAPSPSASGLGDLLLGPLLRGNMVTP